jgi:hypothetical protein
MFSSLKFSRPGFIAPAVLLLIGIGAMPAVAQVQQQPPPGPGVAQPLVSPMPVPNQLELSKLIWSTIAAVDHANMAGNYSVLRDLAAPGFQTANDAARLTQIFAGVRQSGIDLSNALLLAPTYSAPPTMVAPDVLRVQGGFGLRPTAILFDLHYQWVGGRWRLFGISIGTQGIASEQPAPPPGR